MIENESTRRGLRSAALAVVLTAAVASTVPAQEADNLADELIRMRGEVEELHTQLATLKEQHLGRMSALARERGDLEADVNRERLALQELEADIAENQSAAEVAGGEDSTLAPAVHEAIDAARAHVAASLPFKLRERQAALDEIDGLIRSGTLPPAKAVNRLWAFYEDELRLTRENGIYRQSIELDGASRLADVARLGMVMMFFRTGEDGYGRVVRRGDGWSYELLDDAADRDRVAHLFDSLEKQVRTGYFELPNALDLSGGAS